jgi:hypothetical protein
MTADLLSTLIAVLGLISAAMHVILVVRCRELKALNAIIAFGCLWLAVVFGLNSLHLVINAAGMTGGRPGTVVVLAAVMSRAIYSYRNRRRVA